MMTSSYFNRSYLRTVLIFGEEDDRKWENRRFWCLIQELVSEGIKTNEKVLIIRFLSDK